MPPPKAKLYIKKGKSKIPKFVSEQPMPSPSASTSTSSNGCNSEFGQQFEVELYWCIQQLENSLNSGKLNARQMQDIEKTLKILKSVNQPVIKKRQIMRSTFGDYREKMAAEEKKMLSMNKQIKFVGGAPSQKSYFVKKSALLLTGTGEFKFEFPVDKMRDITISDDNCNNSKHEENHDASQAGKSYDLPFISSGNAFKFNFQVDDTTK